MSADTTSEGGYKGDSVGKKIARVYLWLRILHRTKHLNGRYCYLASKDGGDASILAGMGIPADRQLAVDRDPKALATFSEKYPDVPTACGNVDDVVCGLNEKFSAIYLDFCACGSREIFHVCTSVVTKIMPTGIFAYAAMRGREIDQADSLRVGAARAKDIMERFAETNGLAETINDNKKNASKETLSATEKIVGRFMDGRSLLFEEYALRQLTSLRIHLLSNTSIVYQSRTNESRGVPMMVNAWKVNCYGRGTKLSKFVKDATESASGIVRHQIYENQQLGLPNGRLGPIRQRARFSVDLSDATMGNLIELAAVIPDYDKSFDVPKVLNTDSRQLAAWRAHYTQGRYKAAEIMMV